MLRLVALVDQWRAIADGLPEGWGDARLRLTVEHEAQAARAAALLGPVNAGRHGTAITFTVASRRSGSSPELVRRLLARLDAEGIGGSLELVRLGETPAAAEVRSRPGLAAQWDAAVAALPEDWSDLYAELELASSDHLEPGALLLAPVNPARRKADARAKPARPESGAASDALNERPAFRFRVAKQYGYGASAGMTRRCLERLDDRGIEGQLRILRALSDTKPVYTQGPVWYVGGRAV
jgi:hypothetical protein